MKNMLKFFVLISITCFLNSVMNGAQQKDGSGVWYFINGQMVNG